MEFRIQCLVTRHPSGRVTYEPLDLPQLAYHAPSVEAAEEDLSLAIDDRVTRAHPRRVTEFARGVRGELKSVFVDAITVWHGAGHEMAPMRLNLVVSPAQKPYVEVRSLRLDLRVWLPAGDDVLVRAAPYFHTHLLSLSEAERLALRTDGDEDLRVLTVDTEPARLAELKRRELRLDERPPPLPDDLAAPHDPEKSKKKDPFDDLLRDDDDDDEPGAKKKKRPATPTLAKLGVALHKLAEKGELSRAWEVDTLVDTLVARLSAKNPSPIVIVGDAGAGKTAVVHELAARLFEATRDKKDERRPFFHVDASRLIAGEGFFGDWQQQVYDVLEECRRADALLYLGHVVELLDAGIEAFHVLLELLPWEEVRDDDVHTLVRGAASLRGPRTSVTWRMIAPITGEPIMTFHTRPLDPTNEAEVALVAQRMRETLREVVSPEEGESMYTLDWLVERVRFHVDPTKCDGQVFLAVSSTNDILGHTIVRIEGGEGYFSTFYVVPSARRQGIARRFVEVGESWMRQRGMRVSRTNTAATNTKLHELLFGFGYQIVVREGRMVSLTRALLS